MTQKINIHQRKLNESVYRKAQEAGLDEMISRVVAGRVDDSRSDCQRDRQQDYHSDCHFDLDAFLHPSLKHLSDPMQLPDMAAALQRLAFAVINHERIAVVTDYDVDGITSHTLIRQCLVEDFGVKANLVSGFIGHRLKEGYGLSDPVCERVLAAAPQVLITADCGSADHERIERLSQAGIDVIVTDHHGIPDHGVPHHALATISPARMDSSYDDRSIAGCTVAWLVMSALRNRLIKESWLAADTPKLTRHLDLVALGTVADAVSMLSNNNRALVEAGLAIMNRLQRPCWRAAAQLLNRSAVSQCPVFTADDLGFQIGPRINARGRLADPFAAWHFLKAEDDETAQRCLAQLDEDNQQRRMIEKAMVKDATLKVKRQIKHNQQTIVIYDDQYHAGVQGIVASRLVDAFGRVTCVLSPRQHTHWLTGSLRSIPSVDVSCALKTVDQMDASLLHRFGGHPAAAGITLAMERIDEFQRCFDEAVRMQIGDTKLSPVIHTDGRLRGEQLCFETWDQLQQLAPYGRGFDKPLFESMFTILRARFVGGSREHLSLFLSCDGYSVNAIWFNAVEHKLACAVEQGDQWYCVYELQPDHYRGDQNVQLIVRHAEKV